MCVIICKPAGIEMPTDRILKAAQMANPHGCGFASPTRYHKSLSFNSFMAQLRKVKKEEPCIIHFRLATHGSIKKANCHPFKKGDVSFAHNGILDICPKGDKTDSETAFDGILYPTIEKYGLDSDDLYYVVTSIIGYSKFAFLQGCELRMFGNFIECDDGCYYSNLRFLHYTTFNVSKKAV